MLCEICQVNEATVRMVAIENGNKEEHYYCKACLEANPHLNKMIGAFPGLGSLGAAAPRGGMGRISSRLTQNAVQALQWAERYAKEHHSAYVHTEHILLALFEREGLAARVLDELKLHKEVLAEAIDHEENLGARFAGLSPHSKRALQLAVEEAVRMGLTFVDTEHILLGLAAEGEGHAAAWLRDMADADAARIRSIIYELIEQYRGASAAAKPEEGAAAKKATSTPTTDKFSRDLTQLAREEQLDPVIGREKEIERVIQILSRRTKNNPVLIGEPGVGKTAIAEGLAQLIVEGKVPETLAEKRVLALDMSALVAGSKFRGEFEERMKKVMDEVSAAKDVVLFIDEVHTLVGAGAAEGSIDAANIMKPALSRGELQCIGATTLNEYRESIEKDSALERRFQPVMVGEPTEAEALAILKGLRDKYEAHHRVEISDAALEAAVKLSTRYLPDRFLPDKAIDLIDEACSRVRLAAHTAPRDLKELELRIDALRKEKEAAVTMQDYEKAAQLRDEEARLSAEIAEGRRGWEKETAGTNLCIGTNDIAEVLSGWTNIPLTQLTEEESTRLLKLEETLHKRVIGQDEAVVSISRAVRRARAGLKSAERPIGSFIFLGPTGVGKTELAKALAEAMFGSQDNMVRIDMSEYMEKHAVSRLVGAPPGYIGYDEGGQLTEAVRRRPYSVVLLDEIEKAHPDVFNILLQVLDDGRLTDSNGRTVDFRNTIIIMTSNVGAKDLSRGRSMGFLSRDDEEAGYAKMKEQVMAAMKECFRPEFINRLDDAIVFHQLTEAEIESICRLMVDDVSRRLAEKGMFISATAGVYRHLAKLGFDKEMGARPLRRTILRQIEDPLSEGILDGRFSAGDVIVTRMKKGQIDLQKKSDAAVEDVAEDATETAAETAAE